jgi:hypothetical protein
MHPLHLLCFACVTAAAGVGHADEAKDAGIDGSAQQEDVAPPPIPVQEAPPPPATSEQDSAVLAEDAIEQRKKRTKLAVIGRIFTRAALHVENDSGTAGQLSLQSARGGLDYRTEYLRAQLEVEVATKPRVKDAYAQLRLATAPKLDVRAGNFKMPFSAIQIESLWTLPMADRGLVDNVLTHRLQVAGRAIGAMISASAGGPLHAQIRAGVFQGRDDAGELLMATADDAFGQDVVVRGSLRPARGIELGLSASVRSGALLEAPIQIEHAYAAELDTVIDLDVGPGRVRVWLEAMIGTSWITGGMLPGHDRTRFLEARAIAAYRIGGNGKHARYAEIYGLGGVIDPDRIIALDRVSEITGGVTYGIDDVWRVQLEVERWMFDDNAPLGIAEFAARSTDSTTLLIQLGAHL